MNRLDLVKFIALHSFPRIKGRALRAEKNKINNLIGYAIKKGAFDCSKDEIDPIEFFRWALTKRKPKGAGLRWPVLKKILNIPPIPNTGKLILPIRHRIIPPEEEVLDVLLKCFDEIDLLKKENDELKTKVESLRVKRKKRKERGHKYGGIRYLE